ncbi:hypothetical protein, partial [Vibrio alginolyticus]|uniref:hypothetical protein n=1 Tax=Vibrio alginolyticus TaxID=663 RepID=UPI001EEC25D3
RIGVRATLASDAPYARGRVAWPAGERRLDVAATCLVAGQRVVGHSVECVAGAEALAQTPCAAVSVGS